MCYQNYTQHSGCGHYGEAYHNRFTPCEAAFKTLQATRGPSSPPLCPPAEFFAATPSSTAPQLKRSNTSAKHRSFFSMSNMLQRSNTTATSSFSRRAVSDSTPASGATSSSSSSNAMGWRNDFGIPDHQLDHVASSCPELTSRTLVSSSAGQVCKECRVWIDAMRSMIEGYDKGRGVRGTPAFKEFLMGREEARQDEFELGLP